LKLIVFVLSQVDKLDELMLAFSKANIRGSTIIHSTGMAKSLIGAGGSMMSYLRTILDPQNTESRTVLTACSDEQVQTIKDVISKVIGPLDVPGSGVLLVLPLDGSDGITISK